MMPILNFNSIGDVKKYLATKDSEQQVSIVLRVIDLAEAAALTREVEEIFVAAPSIFMFHIGPNIDPYYMWVRDEDSKKITLSRQTIKNERGDYVHDYPVVFLTIYK